MLGVWETFFWVRWALGLPLIWTLPAHCPAICFFKKKSSRAASMQTEERHTQACRSDLSFFSHLFVLISFDTRWAEVHHGRGVVRCLWCVRHRRELDFVFEYILMSNQISSRQCLWGKI